MPPPVRPSPYTGPFEPGDPVAVDVFPGRVVTHVGIVTAVHPGGAPGAGLATVHVVSASARRGGVFEEPLDVFAQGGVPYRPAIARLLPREAVVARARTLVGRPYRLLTGNCEHLVLHCLGHAPKSPQLRRLARRVATVAGAVVAGALVAAAGRRASASAGAPRRRRGV